MTGRWCHDPDTRCQTLNAHARIDIGIIHKLSSSSHETFARTTANPPNRNTQLQRRRESAGLLELDPYTALSVYISIRTILSTEPVNYSLTAIKSSATSRARFTLHLTLNVVDRGCQLGTSGVMDHN